MTGSCCTYVVYLRPVVSLRVVPLAVCCQSLLKDALQPLTKCVYDGGHSLCSYEAELHQQHVWDKHEEAKEVLRVDTRLARPWATGSSESPSLVPPRPETS